MEINIYEIRENNESGINETDIKSVLKSLGNDILYEKILREYLSKIERGSKYLFKDRPFGSIIHQKVKIHDRDITIKYHKCNSQNSVHENIDLGENPTPEEIMILANQIAKDDSTRWDYAKSQLHPLTKKGEESLLKSDIGRMVIKGLYKRYKDALKKMNLL